MFILKSSIINVNLTAFYLSWSFSRDLMSFSSSQLCETGSDPLVGRVAKLFPPLGRSVPSSASFSCQSQIFIKKKVQLSLFKEKLCFSSLSPKYMNIPHFDCLEVLCGIIKIYHGNSTEFSSLESCFMCHGFCLQICDNTCLD